jgi:hypothetical protein
MPAASTMEELLPVRPNPWHNVLEIRERAGRRSEDGRVERTAARSEQAERDEAAADLEPPVRDVLVRDAVARYVERRPE